MIPGEELHLFGLAIPLRSMPAGYAWCKSQDLLLIILPNSTTREIGPEKNHIDSEPYRNERNDAEPL